MKKISILLLLSSLAIFGCGKDTSINDSKGEAKPIKDSKLSAVENAPKSSAAAAPVKEVGKLNVLLDEDFEGYFKIHKTCGERKSFKIRLRR